VRGLQAALGDLALLGRLPAAKVFASFIKASDSGSVLTQGTITAFLQGVLLEFYSFQQACIEGPSWMRPRSAAPEGGALRDAVLAAKASLFQSSEEVQRQVAREMLAAMRIYYEQGLNHAGVSADDISAITRSAFVNAGTITTEAVKGLGVSLSPSQKGRVRQRFPGKDLA
jgi:hypothetical protein